MLYAKAVKSLRFFLGVSLSLALVACGKGSQESSPPPEPTAAPTVTAPSVDATAKAKEIFAQRCTPCHGATGEGDGPASAALDPKPRRFSDGEWQKSVNDDHLMKVIKFGGAAVGKSAAMPGNPDLSDPAVVAALKDVVRGFAK